MSELDVIGRSLVNGILSEVNDSLPSIVESLKTSANVSGIAQDILSTINNSLGEITATLLPQIDRALQESVQNACTTLFFRLILPTCGTLLLCYAASHFIRKL